jgi:FMN-dependent NADH-azoreductase
MARLLHILAHPDPDNSRTGRLAAAFLQRYADLHPDDDIFNLDLYQERIPFVTAHHLAAFRKHRAPDEMSGPERQAWEDVSARVRQFMEADKYLVTAPMWNFTVPAILKAYLDLIVVAGQTFHFDPSGAPVGMLAGRRMVLVSTCGGSCALPELAEFEINTRYLRAIFGFMGIEVIGEIVAEGTNLLGEQETDRLLDDITSRARELAERL